MKLKLTAYWLRRLARHHDLGMLGATLCETANEIDGYTNGYTKTENRRKK